MKKPKSKKNGNYFSLLNKLFLIQLILCSLLAIPLHASAKENTPPINTQQRTITGSVSDEMGPMLGVSIVVKGTTTGTTTDFDGNYSIAVDNDATVLVFSYIGYKAQEVTVGSKSTINITLETDAENLEEVVVLGYTTRKKGEVTGSVSSIKSEDIEKTSNKDLAKSLAGKVSGLIVNDRGGYPGSTGDVSLLIRGKSTLNNNSPLILIDGVVSGSFSQLSPQDVASITILKDGAAAIYGARAANGVILVTTKRGKSGKPKINISSSYNLSSFSVKPSLMSSEQYAIYENEITDRLGQAPRFTQEQIDKYASGTDPLNFPSTDWSDLTFARTSPESRNTISISGGNEDVKYFVSGDFIKQVGLFKSGDLKFKQNQVRSNLDIKLTDDIKIGVDISGRFGNTQEPGVDAGFIYKHIYTNEPTQAGIYPNGLPGWGGENGANPYVMSSNQSGFLKRIDNTLRGRFSFDWDLNKITPGLSFKSLLVYADKIMIRNLGTHHGRFIHISKILASMCLLQVNLKEVAKEFLEKAFGNLMKYKLTLHYTTAKN